MAFIDPKEETLNITLTEHGKKALVNGKFKPAYYAFSDDEVDYENKLDNNLTGSDEQRTNEISNNWINFEPMSSTDFAISYNLYSVPLGQKYEPQLEITSGAFSSSTSGIEIEKEVHLFRSQGLAEKFLREETTRENVALVKKTVIQPAIINAGRVIVPEEALIEVHTLNVVSSPITFDFIDFEEKAGFYIDVYLSESGGFLKRTTKEIKKNLKGIVVSDTYLKHFDIKSDKLDGGD